MFDLAVFLHWDALSEPTPKGFVSTSSIEVRLFCLLGKCENHYENKQGQFSLWNTD